jgi:hypothetical protein
MPPLRLIWSLTFAFAGLLAAVRADDAPQQRQPQQRPAAGVYKAQLDAHWFADGTRFWYRNDLRSGAREFILVVAESGERGPAFDHAKLAASLSKAAAREYKANRLPFDAIDFIDKAVTFVVGKTTWNCDLATYECSKIETKKAAAPVPEPDVARIEPEEFEIAPDERETLAFLQPRQRDGGAENRSPDRKWTAFVKENNVFVRSTEGVEPRLSDDGKDGLRYGLLNWSPDSKSLVAFRIEPNEPKDVYRIESSPAGGGRAKLATSGYRLPGDKYPTYELAVFDVAAKKAVKPEVEKIDFDFPRVRWSKDGHSFTYQKIDRGHQRFRLIEVDTRTAKARTLIDEKSGTFIWTAHFDGMQVNKVTFLNKTDEIVFASERDGWRHLYLVDAKTGQTKNAITTGEYVVRDVERIDEDKRQIWFRASGRNAGQDPYFLHYYRVDFDGTNLVALTDGDGTHTAKYSPDGKYLIDTYSRVDMAPVHELRRTADGKFVCELERADIDELKANGWTAPEVLVAKGRDGKTDIWGIICRPREFDPKKNYPVIESIYAGPHGAHVPKAFSGFRRFSNLTDLGFIVVQMDGMGTAHRSKAFHDVCWKNLKDAGFPDRILWHQAAAKKYPYYDLTRVGIFGTSAGGQNAAGAVLFHPEFYKAAVASCGCHDNRMDKASWNEQWMGYPVGPHYAACSNVENARRLSGKLLLTVGELDDNVPPELTYRFCDALIKARKDFEFLLVPGMRHGDGGAYGRRRIQDFFVRHLHGVEPPDHNAGPQGTDRTAAPNVPAP